MCVTALKGDSDRVEVRGWGGKRVGQGQGEDEKVVVVARMR